MPAKRRLPHRFKRFRQWLKQFILLGRTDWRKASDDASPPRLSQSERVELQPHFDVNAIKPRSIAAVERDPRSTPPPATSRVTLPPVVQAPPEDLPAGTSKPGKTRVFRKRRRERPPQIAANPLSVFKSDHTPASRLERLYLKIFGPRD